MASAQELESFLMRELQDPDLEIEVGAEAVLKSFDFSVLDRLPTTERAEVVKAFVGAMPPRPPGPPPLPNDVLGFPGANERPMRRINARNIAIGSSSLKSYLDSRGLENMSPQARAIFTSCDCWPF